jgi:hypothetical protein
MRSKAEVRCHPCEPVCGNTEIASNHAQGGMQRLLFRFFATAFLRPPA